MTRSKHAKHRNIATGYAEPAAQISRAQDFTPSVPPVTGPRIPVSRFSTPTPTARWMLRIVNGPNVLFMQETQTVGRMPAPGTSGSVASDERTDKRATTSERTITIADSQKQISRQHFRFGITASNQPWIQDCDSLNGTLLYRAGTPFPVPTNRRLPLRAGDVIRFGTATAIVMQQ